MVTGAGVAEMADVVEIVETAGVWVRLGTSTGGRDTGFTSAGASTSTGTGGFFLKKLNMNVNYRLQIRVY